MDKKLFCIYTIITCIIVFTLPYFFPLSEPVQSMSYLVGFNNKIGLILTILLCTMVLLYGWKKIRKTKIDTNNEFWNLTSPTYGSKKILIWCIFITFVCLIISCLCFDRENFFGTGESEYCIRYIYALKFGASLYDEIQFIYGPLYVYPAYWLTLFGLNVTKAYFIVLLIFQVSGQLLLYYILGHINISYTEKNWILILLSIVLFPTSFGINYTLLRADMSVAFFLLIIKKGHSFIQITFLLSITSLIIFLSSPEFGIGFMITNIIFFAVKGYFYNWKNYFIAFIPLCIISLTLIIYPQYMSSITEAVDGGANLPFIPCISLVMLFASLIILSYQTGFDLNNIPKNINSLGLTLLIVSTLPYGLGRCDPSHILWGCLFILIMGYYYISKSFNKIFVRFLYILILLPTLYWGYYIVVLYDLSTLKYINKEFFISVLDTANDYGFALPEFIKTRIQAQIEQDKLFIKEGMTEELISDLTTTTSINCDNEVYLLLNKYTEYHETYFSHNQRWIGGKKGFEKELKDLKDLRPEYIIFPKGYLSFCKAREFSNNMLNRLFFSYYIMPIKYAYGDYLYDDMINYIQKEYRPYRSNSKIEIYRIVQ